MSAEERVSLEREARYLHRAFFLDDADDRVVDRYVKACLSFEGTGAGTTGLAIDMKKLVELGLDAEAVEFALRGRANLLSLRLQILFYLVEARASHYPRFVNDADNRLGAHLALGIAVLRSALLKVKGRYLVWRYGLV